jgi:signal transduction histidine kinase
MSKKPWWQRKFDSSDWAIFVLVGVAYLAIFAIYGNDLSLLVKVLLVVAGVVYIVLSLWGADYVGASGRLRLKVGYFLIQLSLASAIFYFGLGAAWLLLLPLSAQTVYMFSRRGILVANGLIFLASLLVIYLLSGSWSALVQSGVAFIAAMVFVVIFTRITVKELNARQEVERLAAELRQANQKLRAYAVQVEELATLQERNRLAREIHDGLGHYLTALNMQIKAAQAVLDQDTPRVQSALSKAQALAQDALADVRRSVAALRGEPLLNRPLPDALAALLDECRGAGLVVELTVQGEYRPLLPQADFTLYRAAQEALTNVRKHSLASRVDVTLEYHPAEAILTIADNGVGAAQIDDVGFGLYGLRERLTLLGGSINVVTAPGQGFRLEVIAPAKKAEPKAET